MIRSLLIAAGCALVAWADSCLPVDGEHIRARDLARAVSEFAAIPPDTELGWAPAPGIVRRFSRSEVDQLARSHGLPTAGILPVCFSWAMQPLPGAQIQASIDAALAKEGRGMSFQLVDSPHAAFPPGPLEFSLSGLAVMPGGVAIWRGRLRYLPSRTLPVSVKGKLSARGAVAVAAQDLAAGKEVLASQIRMEDRALTFRDLRAHPAPDSFAGLIPKRQIAAGTLLRRLDFVEPYEVARGETVVVDVRKGAAQIRLDARAETAGRSGQLVLLRSPVNGKRLRARVTGKRSAVLEETE